MKKNTPLLPTEERAEDTIRYWDSEIAKKEKPSFFKLGRDANFQLAKIEPDLFAAVEGEEKGNYIISGITKRISQLDFAAFTLALGQILYNQSIQFGNADVNSGFKRTRAEISDLVGMELYSGVIIARLTDICRLGWGVADPTTELKKKVASIIDMCHNTPVRITYPNGREIELPICVKHGKDKAADGAVIYALWVNPVFSSRIQSQYGELPQDITERLNNAVERKSAEHYYLLKWLSAQDKRKPHKLTIEKLVSILGNEDYYRGNRGKAEKKIISICNTMVELGLLSKYEIATKPLRGKEYIKSITFFLNPDFK